MHGATVEDEVMIGMRAVVLNGASIGSGSVIAAGCVVPEGMNVPPNSVVMGVPGRVKREVDSDDRVVAISFRISMGEDSSHGGLAEVRRETRDENVLLIDLIVFVEHDVQHAQFEAADSPRDLAPGRDALLRGAGCYGCQLLQWPRPRPAPCG